MRDGESRQEIELVGSAIHRGTRQRAPTHSICAATWDRCEKVVLGTNERLIGFGGTLVERFFGFAGSF